LEVILIEIKRTKVEEKAENILLEIYPTLKNYTNAEKYRLCERIVNSFLDLLSFLGRANKVRSKRKYYLNEADACLQHCKNLNRISYKRKEINKGFYKNIDSKLSGIGRMIGAWIKKS